MADDGDDAGRSVVHRPAAAAPFRDFKVSLKPPDGQCFASVCRVVMCTPIVDTFVKQLEQLEAFYRKFYSNKEAFILQHLLHSFNIENLYY